VLTSLLQLLLVQSVTDCSCSGLWIVSSQSGAQLADSRRAVWTNFGLWDLDRYTTSEVKNAFCKCRTTPTTPTRRACRQECPFS